MKTVRVELGDRSYPILIGAGLLPDIGRLLKRQNLAVSQALLVSQKEIASRHGQTVLDSLKKEGIEASVFLTPEAKSSEAAKSAPVFWKLIHEMSSKSGKNKGMVVLALGGGVIGDLAGFAASIYRRGVPYVQIPTTLTAQVDSAIGGKTAIDLPEGKNLLGSIYQPAMVLADTSVLETLPSRFLSDGFAEVIKYGVIEDAGLFALLEKKGKAAVVKDKRLFEEVIERCARIKAKVVSQDEHDRRDVRIVLNFGHTAGHGIEAASSFSHLYTHGQAVAIGMLVACDIARSLGVLKEEKLSERLEALLIKYDLPVFYKGLETKRILEAMGHDKKSLKGKNRFVLPVKMGRTEIVSDVPLAVIQEALQKRRR